MGLNLVISLVEMEQWSPTWSERCWWSLVISPAIKEQWSPSLGRQVHYGLIFLSDLFEQWSPHWRGQIQMAWFSCCISCCEWEMISYLKGRFDSIVVSLVMWQQRSTTWGAGGSILLSYLLLWRSNDPYLRGTGAGGLILLSYLLLWSSKSSISLSARSAL